MPLRLFVSGRPSVELDALRQRLMADADLQLVDRVELADAIVSLPRSRGAAEQRDQAAPRRADAGTALIEALTAREHEVLTRLADGLPNREIARALAISEHTVKFHLAAIFGKLGVSTRTEAVHRGIRLGIIEI